jgi:phospholipid N-methyltransferase
MRFWTECQEFYTQFRDRYRTTGSIMPSSPSLARALVSELRKQAPPRRLLEVGPGTGSTTVAILQRLRPGDRLDIVELNEDFVRVLRQRFEEDALFRRWRDQARLIHAPIQEVKGEGVYDFAVSSVPHNILPLALVRDIFHSYRRLLKPGGVLSFYEYYGIRPLKRLYADRRLRRYLHVMERFLYRHFRAYEIAQQTIFFNMPPAVAHHLRFAV